MAYKRVSRIGAFQIVLQETFQKLPGALWGVQVVH